MLGPILLLVPTLSIIKVLKVLRPHELEPVHEILAGSSTHVIPSELRELSEVDMEDVVDAYESLDDCPNGPGQEMDDRSELGGEGGDVEEVVKVVVDEVRNLEEIQGFDQSAPLVPFEGGRGDAHKGLEVGVDLLVEGVSDEPLGSSLGVADIDHLGEACKLGDVVEVSWDILGSHFVEGEVPELLVVSSVLHVGVGEDCPSAVGDPHLVTSVHQLQSQIQGLVIEEPGSSVIQEPMLHVHWLLDPLGHWFPQRAWNPESCQDIPIPSGDGMGLAGVSLQYDLIRHSLVIVRWVGQLWTSQICEKGIKSLYS
mmetsp:Transcript_14266/g.13837  ORF Transcript_14266/g.13837 Transcript_14266/m.13837 type:complete len:312 (+) Transcript_14266:285-1220(+)